ncbi:hypothetical protein P7C73_g6831, partial [Tremellales sp. Uapishka_1]
MDSNPDSRPLPDGWTQQFNPDHKTWFYVNKNAPGGPKSQWTHPADDQPYAPPPGPPPGAPSRGGNGGGERSYSPQQPQSYSPQQQQPTYGQQQAYNAQPSYQPQQQYSQQQPQQKGLGGLFSKLTGKMGGSQQYGGGYPQQQQQYGGGGYPQQQQYGGYPQQQQYAQQAPRRSGLGTGGAAALGVGGGLLGGMLLMDAVEDVSRGCHGPKW